MDNIVIEGKNLIQENSDGTTSTYSNESINQSQTHNKDVIKSMENMNIDSDKKEQSNVNNNSLVNNNDNINKSNPIENKNNTDNDNSENNNSSSNNNNGIGSTSVQSYYLKTIDWKDFDKGTSKIVRIILQNENGPCPLVSICNVLLIRGDIQIRPFERSTVTFDYLVECLGDYLLNHAPNDEKLPNSNSLPKLSSSPSNLSGENLDQKSTLNSSNNKNNYKQSTMEYVLTYRHNLDTAFTILPHLQTGLDVNVHFNSIYEFEPTAELALFDLFNVNLVHGWIVDPQDKETYRVVVESCKSYNGVTECIVRGNENMDQSNDNNKNNDKDTISNSNNNSNDSSRDDNIHDGLVAGGFLEDTATQLTYYGIELLRDSLPKNKLCVLFRNNHFSTLFKHPITEQLYTLVTDSGYVSESNIVWETLNDVDQGTSVFVNSEFCQNTSVIDQQEQENSDLKYAIELSIKQHQQEIMRTSQTTHSNTSSPSVRTNHTQSSSTKIPQKKKECVIS